MKSDNEKYQEMLIGPIKRFDQRNDIHGLTRKIIRYLPLLNPLIIWLDDLFGYGKQKMPTRIWGP